MSSNSNALSNASNDASQNMSASPAGSPTASCGKPPAAADQPVSPSKTHWVSIELVDELGKHVPYEDYRITLPDGTVIEDSLDKNGRAKISGIDAGTCKVSFPNRDKDTWKKN